MRIKSKLFGAFVSSIVVLLVLGIALLVSPVGTAFAHDPEPAKCNSGRGNGSEPIPATDCDPGKSGGKNKGGD